MLVMMVVVVMWCGCVVVVSGVRYLYVSHFTTTIAIAAGSPCLLGG